MNYLQAFLKEKTHAEKPHIPTDKTDKTRSVSFVSESLTRLGNSSSVEQPSEGQTFSLKVAEPTGSRLHLDREKSADAWSIDEAVAALRSTLRRAEALSCRSSSRTRIRAGDLIAEFGPIIRGLFLRQDLDSLRYCLLDLERNVRDLIARRGYEGLTRR
jgi:hypothetical protein